MKPKENAQRVVTALLKTHDHAILGQPIGPHLAEALPIRTITGLELREGRKLGVMLTEDRSEKARTPRVMYDVAGLMLAWLSIIRSPYFNPETDLHYLDVLMGISFVRVMVGAKAGENVKLGSDHYLLLPEALTIEPTGRYTTDARPRAIGQALTLWDASAKRLGLTTILPRDRYEQIIGETFALFDREYGHLLNRPVKKAAE